MDEDTDARKLVKGNMLHQIFSNTQFIFSVTSTFEKLYRYRFDLHTNEVVEIYVYKRVRKGDPEIQNLRDKKHKKICGMPTSFRSTWYDVYGLIAKRYNYGYLLYARTTYGCGQMAESERMYFAFEKSEKKEGES